jgi:hypothetical protein
VIQSGSLSLSMANMALPTIFICVIFEDLTSNFHSDSQVCVRPQTENTAMGICHADLMTPSIACGCVSHRYELGSFEGKSGMRKWF